MSFKKVTVDWDVDMGAVDTEDCGMVKVANGCYLIEEKVHFRVISVDESDTPVHEFMDAIVGKKVRVTFEVLEDEKLDGGNSNV